MEIIADGWAFQSGFLGSLNYSESHCKVDTSSQALSLVLGLSRVSIAWLYLRTRIQS